MADTPHTPPGTPGDHGHGHSPMEQLWMAMSGASTGHHEEMPGVDAKSAKVGHEPDQFDARTIVYVPIVVAITLVITYLIVQGAFAFVNGKESQQQVELTTESNDPAEIARVQKENETRLRDWNERSARMRNWNAEPGKPATPGGKPLPAVAQPQVEHNKQVNLKRLDANGREVTDPPFIRSFSSTPEQAKGNTPVIYPEDLRPGDFTDPWTSTRLLGESAWVKGHEGKLATVKIDEMIHLVATSDKWKDVLPVAEKKAVITPGTVGKPKASAGGLVGPVPTGEKKKDDGHGHK